MIVNESLVRRYFAPGTDPIGARLEYGNWWKRGPLEVEVVGVVQDVHFSGRTDESYGATYFPHAQQPVREMAIMLRTDGNPFDLVGPLRDAVASIDPGLPVDDVALLADQLAAHEASRRSLAALLVTFATVALALAAIGVYGVMASLVTQRTREMGIRVALGAQQTNVRWLVLRQALSLVAAGILLGLLAAVFLGRLLEQALFEIRPVDPVTMVAVAAFLAVVALTASWVPARRATRVDPMESLRSD